MIDTHTDMHAVARAGGNRGSIYILCPAGRTTGGTEALHQLRYYLESIGKDAYLSYYDEDERFVDCEPPERYAEYLPTEGKIVNGNAIADDPENSVVAPEFSTGMLAAYRNARRIVWWLSVHYYDGGPLMSRLAVRHWLKRSLSNPTDLFRFRKYHHPLRPDAAEHLCASQYAYEYVTESLRMPARRLVEPISKPFLEIGMERERSPRRKDMVAYNPAKPSKVMRELLARNEFDYVPITGMTPEQIVGVLREVKLYVDFGEFPGPERIPKEAAYNGAAVLVIRRNAACNPFDVNIPERYKLPVDTSLDEISRTIRVMLDDYAAIYPDYDVFRTQIDGLERRFVETLREVWG
ncbi:hypothetical protein [Bifidobacterium rousetti]|uniref:hypothetical protein n=1 Tax=Bifidobacterium rousetti TaxID=2045439 RepID=UPI00123A6205|nr:hypothetical protein [Bifidobacterium rousetti]